MELEHNRHLERLIQPLNRYLFDSMGILVESRWFHEFRVKPVNGKHRMEIAGETYLLTQFEVSSRYLSTREAHGTLFGEGHEISPIGEEVFSLIDAKPDPVWIGLLVNIYASFGWKLERDQAPA